MHILTHGMSHISSQGISESLSRYLLHPNWAWDEGYRKANPMRSFKMMKGTLEWDMAHQLFGRFFSSQSCMISNSALCMDKT
jgi:hypothetical protein